MNSDNDKDETTRKGHARRWSEDLKELLSKKFSLSVREARQVRALFHEECKKYKADIVRIRKKHGL